jgi:hypothetical protein
MAELGVLPTDVDGLNPDTFFNMCGIGIIGDFVRQDLGFAQGIDKSRSPGARGTFDLNVQKEGVYLAPRKLTDHHDGELDALFDLVPSASACERHL